VSRQMLFYKIFDEKLAIELSDGGFLYTTETVNNNQKVYCFKKTKKLEKEIKKITKKYGDNIPIVVTGNTLNF